MVLCFLFGPEVKVRVSLGAGIVTITAVIIKSMESPHKDSKTDVYVSVFHVLHLVFLL